MDGFYNSLINYEGFEKTFIYTINKSCKKIYRLKSFLSSINTLSDTGEVKPWIVPDDLDKPGCFARQPFRR